MHTEHSVLELQKAGEFGSLLRHWRLSRRLTQIDLASDAGISARHLSFLETSRARPSRDMVSLLAGALDLPLGEQNALHMAAGFVPPFDHRTADGAGLPQVRQALDFILRQQEPFPGIVVDGHWNIRQRNQASRKIFGLFHRVYDMPAEIADNAMHVVFHPKGLRPFIENWDDFARFMIQILHREVAQGSRDAAALRDEILSYPKVPADWRLPLHSTSSPVMTLQLRHGDSRLAFFSTFTRFAMPCDAALQELKIECFYPADTATDVYARDLAAGAL